MYDVLIVGAGPAGSATALALQESGLKVALTDKESFPRDKVCGDFVMARSVRYLDEVAPGFRQKMEAFPHKVENRQTTLYVYDNTPLTWSWVQRSYTLKRFHFDHLLLQEALERIELDFMPGTKITHLEERADGILARSQKGEELRARLVIGADGAHSVVSRLLGGFKLDHDHYGGSVRAYYRGVQHIHTQANEVYISKKVVPGYFWLFPLSENTANVGLGMHSKYITKRQINLKKLFSTFIEEHPVLQDKLGNAELEGGIRGFGLPFYSKRRSLCGPRHLLTGDAGSLIDPTNGEGIYQAVVTGLMAGRFARQLLTSASWKPEATKAYEKEVHGRFWREMRFKAALVHLFADKSKLQRTVGKWCLEQPLVSKTIKSWI